MKATLSMITSIIQKLIYYGSSLLSDSYKQHEEESNKKEVFKRCDLPVDICLQSMSQQFVHVKLSIDYEVTSLKKS